MSEGLEPHFSFFSFGKDDGKMETIYPVTREVVNFFLKHKVFCTKSLS